MCVGRGWVTRGSRAERFREDLEKAREVRLEDWRAKKGGKGKGKNKKEERRRADWLRNEERRVESRLCTVGKGRGWNELTGVGKKRTKDVAERSGERGAVMGRRGTGRGMELALPPPVAEAEESGWCR